MVKRGFNLYFDNFLITEATDLLSSSLLITKKYAPNNSPQPVRHYPPLFPSVPRAEAER
jgi:hypothetical protein